MTEGALALLAAELGNLDCGAQPDARRRDAQRRPRLLRRLPHQGRPLPRGRRARAEVLDRAQPGDRPAAERRRARRQAAEQAKTRAELAGDLRDQDRRRVGRDPRQARLLRRGRDRARRAAGPPAAPRARGVLLDRRRRGRRPDHAGPHAARHPDGAGAAAAARPAHRARCSPSTASRRRDRRARRDQVTGDW